MSTDSDLDVIQEQESFLAGERQKNEERQRLERRGWYITWTAVVGILLVTVLVTVALSAGDKGADLATGGFAPTYRIQTTFKLNVPGQRQVVTTSQSYVDNDRGLIRLVAEIPNDSGVGTVNLESITTPEGTYLKFGTGYTRPAAVPAEKEWVFLPNDSPEYQALTQSNATSGALNGSAIDPDGFLDTLPEGSTIKEVRTEQLRGAATTVNRVQVDTGDYYTSLGQPEIGSVVEQQLGETMTFTVWVDDEGFLHRWRLTATVQGAKAEVVIDIFADEPVDITIPDESLVYENTASPSPQASASPSGASETFGCTGQAVGEEQTADC